MTAAHCVVPDGSVRPRRRALDIVAGHLRLRGASAARIHVLSVRVHPGFDPSSLVNDLALLELAKPVTGAAVLDTGADEVAGGSATAIGWGSTTASAAGDFPDAMRQTALDVEPDANCTQAYGDGYDASTMLCAGVPQGGRDTCQGDSGGPLVNAAGTVVIGFTSFGGACGQAGAPGAYVRASIAAAWLAAGGVTSPDRMVTLPLRRTTTTGIRPLAKPKRPRSKH